jgi:hypothetical protein
MGLKEYKLKRSFLGWACRAGTRDFCSALAASVGPVQNIFVPIHSQLAKQASRAGLPYLFMCLWPRHTPHSSLTLLNISALLALYLLQNTQRRDKLRAIDLMRGQFL